MFGRKNRHTVDGPLTHESLRAWLVTELARRVKCAESEVDTAKPFDAYGLDSRAAVQVSGALEKVVERRLSPAILFDHGTIDDLAAYLTQRTATPRPMSACAKSIQDLSMTRPTAPTDPDPRFVEFMTKSHAIEGERLAAAIPREYMQPSVARGLRGIRRQLHSVRRGHRRDGHARSVVSGRAARRRRRTGWVGSALRRP